MKGPLGQDWDESIAKLHNDLHVEADRKEEEGEQVFATLLRFQAMALQDVALRAEAGNRPPVVTVSTKRSMGRSYDAIINFGNLSVMIELPEREVYEARDVFELEKITAEKLSEVVEKFSNMLAVEIIQQAIPSLSVWVNQIRRTV